MGCLAVVFVTVVVGLGVTVLVAYNTVKEMGAMDARLRAVPDFTVTEKVIAAEAGLAIDHGRHKVCLLNRHGARILSYSNILAVDIIEDGKTVTRTDRSSQIAGAVAGGLVAGGIGAVIGGLSGRTETVAKVRSVTLRLTIDDVRSPHHDVDLLDLEADADSAAYRSALAQARHWHGVMAVVLAQKEG